jgi:hypothetical protein
MEHLALTGVIVLLILQAWLTVFYARCVLSEFGIVQRPKLYTKWLNLWGVK